MRKHFYLYFIGLAIILFIAAFIYSFNKKERADISKYNLIFIAFDGLQAKHLHSNGYFLDTTPNLDKFLSESYVFKNTVSPASWTVPSFMSIFTSMYPSEHKVVNKFANFDSATGKGVTANLKNLSPNAVTLAQVLKQNGYMTAGFTGDAGVSGIFGDNLGFDEFYDKKVFSGFNDTIPRALDWLKNRKEQKFFLFLHGYDVHGQYAPQGGFDYRYVKKPYQGKYTGSIQEQGQLREEGLKNGFLNLSKEDVDFWRAIYDEKINRADSEFKNFMDSAENLGLMDNTIFVLFSDHGTELYEHKRFDHGHTLYSELLDVLFVIHLPNEQQGKEIKDLVSTLDITPTVLKLLNIDNPVSQQTKGIDITPVLSDSVSVSHDVYSETDYRLYTHKRSITTQDGWKFILTMNGPLKELYNLNNDSSEQNNLIDNEPKIAYELEQKVYKHLNDMNAANGPWILGCLPVYGDQCKTLTSPAIK